MAGYDPFCPFTRHRERLHDHRLRRGVWLLGSLMMVSGLLLQRLA